MIKKIFLLFATVFLIGFVSSAADFAVTSFSCTPSEVAVNEVFSCTAQIKNNGDSAGSVSVATLYPDTNDWLESSNYPQASGTSVNPGQSVTVTFSGLRATVSGDNGFSKIMLDSVTDTYVADNNIKVNTINVVILVSNSISSQEMGGEFTTTVDVTAGGEIDVVLTYATTSGGCTISNQGSQKTISGMQDGNAQSRSWTVTMGTSGDCIFTISAAATGVGGIATKTDSVSSTIDCTDCSVSSDSSSPGGGSGSGSGGGGSGGEVAPSIGVLSSEKTIELGMNEKTRFVIEDEDHSITLLNITETTAKFSIKSIEQIFEMTVGDSKIINLDSDPVNEIEITLKSVNFLTKKASFILKPLVFSSEASKDNENNVGKDKEDVISKGAKKIAEIAKSKTTWAIILIIVLVFIIFLIVSGYYGWNWFKWINLKRSVKVRES